MNVCLTLEFEQFVQEKVKSGRYQSASEVIGEALRLLEKQDKTRQMRIEQLRSQIAIGIDQGNQGEVFDSVAFGVKFNLWKCLLPQHTADKLLPRQESSSSS
ncbi:MAG: type II toxin-antitoxin system ParD family antitoxin [Symploca sp. SIO2E6]|nr:type II toxin-antitoxin system ParD family antitoxin [Symploca sp. SIO2E6]